MKIRLVNKEIYEVIRVDIVDGRLEIDFQDKTAEEIQDIFINQVNISNIELLTDEDEMFGELPGWTVYGGVTLVGDIRTVILTKEADSLAERLTNAEAKALAASVLAESVKNLSEDTASQVTDLQLALCEIFEGMEV